MSDMITVTIDGIECTCEKGELLPHLHRGG